MNSSKTNKKELRDTVCSLLSKRMTVRIKASGHSMYPSVKPGNFISIEAVSDAEKLMPGEIVAWYRDFDLVSHRLLHIYKSGNIVYCITRGDASPASDAPVKFDDLAGRICLVEKRNNTIKPPAKSYIPEWRYKYNRLLVWFVVRIKKII